VRAAALLADWDRALKQFRQLIPIAVPQPAPAPVPAESLEEAPKTTA
jgi:hypothetical protein